MHDLDKALAKITAIRSQIAGRVISRLQPGDAAAADLAGASR
jgi:hypothetical protein